MKFLKASWKGLVLILIIFIINALIWLTASPLIAQPLDSTLAQSLGANILLTFTFVFFLATKNRLVTWLFNGLENVYIVHRFLAIFALLQIFLHTQNTYLIFQYYRGDLPLDAVSMGPWARNLFIALIILALLARYMKYEHWRYLHRLMIIPYLLAVYHAYFISSYALLAFSPLGLWMGGFVLLGLGSSFYMIILYRRIAFTYSGVVETIHAPADDVTEMTIKLTKPYLFKHGQFTFIKIDRPPFKGEPHPFSISGGSEDKLIFTMKALGDFTKTLKANLNVGDTIKLTKPYGHMTFDDYQNEQVWIAGGIGITPFLSHLRNTQPPTQNITLYYSVRQKEEAVHLDHLKALDKQWSNFTLHFTESDQDGLLSVEKLDLAKRPTVFMCGPVPMAKALKKQFKQTDQHRALIYEAFSFTGTLAADIENVFFKRFRRF